MSESQFDLVKTGFRLRRFMKATLVPLAILYLTSDLGVILALTLAISDFYDI